MDFFARQERSKRTSRYLVGLFVLSFLIVALATTAVVAAALRMYTQNHALFLGTESWSAWVASHALLLTGIAAGTLGLMGLASLIRAASLARGGGQVARMLGARQINGEDADPLHRRLSNVVEEMALASGLPVPEIYVLEQEPAINAFAAGLSHGDAAIAVTRGTLERLDRAELQGVVAHEFSHILNGDMRLNQQLIGLSFGILVLSLAGRWLLRSARYGRRGRNSGGVAAALGAGAALTVIGAIGVLLSRLIKAAVSRQRELLADASAVQFTREPSGLAGALKKIGGYTGQFSSVDTEEIAHMLFARGARSFGDWLATHPPLVERIRALEPTFDPQDMPTPGRRPSAAPRDETVHALADSQPSGATPTQLLQRAGESESAEVGHALRTAVPEELYHAAHARESSLLLVLALALAAEERTRQRQWSLLENQLGAERTELCRRLHAELQNVGLELRLPLLELALPAVKQRPSGELQYLFELIGRLTALDDGQRLFDYVLMRVLAAYLLDSRGAAFGGLGHRSKLSTRDAVRVLLLNVAAFGHETETEARAAYRAGLTDLGAKNTPLDGDAGAAGAMRDLQLLDSALERLATLSPDTKRRVLGAVLATIEHDRRITIDEVELFRAIAATLGCPVPPTAAPASATGDAAQIR